MKTLTTLMLTLLLAALVMPAPSDAAQGRRSSGDKGSGKQERGAGKQTGKSAPRGPSFTPGMWAAAAGLYAKKTKDLPKKTGSNAAPRPKLGATTGGRGTTASATGNVMIPVPNASNWSMTATRGRRNSTESRRSISSGTSSSTTLGSLPK